MVHKTTILTILKRAQAGVNNPEKWRQGIAEYPMCTSEALRFGMALVPVIEEHHEEALKALGFDSIDECTAWNDAPTTMWDDVMDLFNEAIIKIQLEIEAEKVFNVNTGAANLAIRDQFLVENGYWEEFVKWLGKRIE